MSNFNYPGHSVRFVLVLISPFHSFPKEERNGPIFLTSINFPREYYYRQKRQALRSITLFHRSRTLMLLTSSRYRTPCENSHRCIRIVYFALRLIEWSLFCFNFKFTKYIHTVILTVNFTRPFRDTSFEKNDELDNKFSELRTISILLLLLFSV